MRVEHTKTQKAVALVAFLVWVGVSGVAIVDRWQKWGSVFSLLPLLLGITVVLLLFGYACWFTLTYRFQADEEGIARSVGFARTKTRWDEVVSWSIKTRSEPQPFNEEPILTTLEGEEFGLDSRVWYSSPNMVRARQEFLALVQSQLPDKQTTNSALKRRD